MATRYEFSDEDRTVVPNLFSETNGRGGAQPERSPYARWRAPGALYFAQLPRGEICQNALARRQRSITGSEAGKKHRIFNQILRRLYQRWDEQGVIG